MDLKQFEKPHPFRRSQHILTVTLGPNIHMRFNELCDERNLNKSAIIRYLLEDLLNKLEESETTK